MTIIGFLGLFDSLGLPAAAARFVAAYSATADVGRLGGFLRGSLALLTGCNIVFAGTVLLAGPWLAVHFYHAPALSSYLWAFALIMFLGVLTTFLGQVMAGYRDVARRTIITHFIGTPANIAFSVTLISLGFGLTGYLAAQVASAFLVLTLLVFAVWKMTPSAARISKPFARVEKEVVTFSLAAFGLAALGFVLSQADTIVLGHYLLAKQVGVYAVAMALIGFVPIALNSVNQIFSPIISELHTSGNRALLQQLYATITKWILILTFPLAMTVAVFSRSLMAIFGPGFQAGAAVVAIGAVGQFFNCAVGSVGYLLLMSGNQLQLVRIQAANAVLMVVLNVLLVPRFGIKGAALAAAITVVSTNLWSLAGVRRTLKLFPYNPGYFKLALPALLSAATVFALLRVSAGMHSQWRVAGLALVGAYGIFLGMIFALGLDNEDRLIAQMMWGRISRIYLRNGGGL